MYKAKFIEEQAGTNIKNNINYYIVIHTNFIHRLGIQWKAIQQKCLMDWSIKALPFITQFHMKSTKHYKGNDNIKPDNKSPPKAECCT